MQIEDHIQDLILQRYGNPHEHETCSCGQGTRTVKCRYDGCLQYPISCQQCFINSHRNNPFHWALVWNTATGVWVKKDYSELSENSFIQLGHQYDQKVCSGTKSAVPIKITHTNGMHISRVRFCGCIDAPDKVSQLVLAELFPATPTEPRSAFTFAVLKHFHMHNLQSKCGAFDYVLSLRRLTDNVFTSKVPVSKDKHQVTKTDDLQDPYKSFLKVTRVWDVLQLKRRSGYKFNITSLIPTRSLSPGLVSLFCPSCPEPGVNMSLGADVIPHTLR
jgi:hypothetical protein